MPGSLDTILGGLRDAGSGIAQGTQAYQNAEKLQAEKDELQAKRDADTALAERVAGATGKVEELHKKLRENPDYGYQDLAEDSKDIVKSLVEAGKPDVADALLKDLRSEVDNREKNKRTSAKATGTEVRAAQKEKRDEEKELYDRTTAESNAWLKEAEPFQKLTKAYGRIEDLSAKPELTPSDQAAVIYGFVKTLDEVTGVRDSETEFVGEANGVKAKAQLLLQKLEKGGKVLPEQIEDIRAAAESLVRSDIKGQEAIDEKFRGRAKRWGVREEDVITKSAKKTQEALDKAAEKRAKKKDAAGNVQEKAEDDGKPAAKVVGKKYMDEVFKLNKDKWAAGLQAWAQKNGRQPSTQERNAWIAEKVKKSGILYDPNLE